VGPLCLFVVQPLSMIGFSNHAFPNCFLERIA